MITYYAKPQTYNQGWIYLVLATFQYWQKQIGLFAPNFFWGGRRGKTSSLVSQNLLGDCKWGLWHFLKFPYVIMSSSDVLVDYIMVILELVQINFYC